MQPESSLLLHRFSFRLFLSLIIMSYDSHFSGLDIRISLSSQCPSIRNSVLLSVQVIRVVNSAQSLTTTVVSHATWVLLGLLLVLLLALGVVLHWWQEKNKLQNSSANHFQSSNGVTSSARYQATQQEVNMMQDGVPNPLYDRTAL